MKLISCIILYKGLKPFFATNIIALIPCIILYKGLKLFNVVKYEIPVFSCIILYKGLKQVVVAISAISFRLHYPL